MSAIWSIVRRELAGYFATPVAYVFIVVFLLLTGIFTFYLGNFFQRGQADLLAFFNFHPWLYLFLVPAIAMRLWSEEHKAGTTELLLTLPLPAYAAVIGKFLAGWIFIGIALLLTLPIWLTVNWLGSPDNGVIVAGYLGSFLMAGGFLAIGACFSGMTSNQVIAFVLSVVTCFLFIVAGVPIVLDLFTGWAPEALVSTVASLSFVSHFQGIVKGVIDLRDLVYFASMIVLWLIANGIVVELRKG
ncbi:ABC transporter permease [Oceanibacterium hippocampi]|uniref:ABC-2 family transporter protein n=1 Tax=Oceanibacterium hippocampi TaxID=745714 RepID=A0A1Y5RFA1_9PROT|nr:ABC transporter permease [Oceanibacterium hippocampi]SLN14868.1 ABC-2 family transporter protein [Oceanibacterium hippocampi]